MSEGRQSADRRERERNDRIVPTTSYPPEARLGSREITSATASRCEFRIYTSRYRELNPRRVLAELFTTWLFHVLVSQNYPMTHTYENFVYTYSNYSKVFNNSFVVEIVIIRLFLSRHNLS